MLTLRPFSILFVSVAWLAAVACSGVVSPDQGNVHVILSASDEAAPVPALTGDDGDDDHHSGDNVLSKLESASVTFASLLARNLDGQLIDLGVDLPLEVDLIALLGDKQLALPAGTLPPGDYDQLVVVMTQLEVTFISGGSVALTPPGGGWTSIVKVTPFTVAEGEDLTIELRLRLRGAFKELGGALRFFPDFAGWHR